MNGRRWGCVSPGRQQGFTIVETLIVLAVTGFLFAGAVMTIGGKQNATQFSHAVRDVQSLVQQALNEVSTGYYTNNGRIKCEAPAGVPVITEVATEQGSNRDCIFMGKVLQFAVAPAGNAETFNSYTVVGLSTAMGSSTVDFAAARPRLIAKDGTSATTNVPDVFGQHKLLAGMTANAMYYDGNPGNAIGSVAFIAGIGSLAASDSSQQVHVVALPGTSRNQNKNQGVAQANAALQAGIVNPPNGVQICFNSGTTNQSVLMTIAGGGRAAAVEMSNIKTGLNCP